MCYLCPIHFFQSTRLQAATVISIFLLESYLEKYLYASYGFPVMTTSDHCSYPKTCNLLCIFRSTNFTNPQTMHVIAVTQNKKQPVQHNLHTFISCHLETSKLTIYYT